MLKRRRCIGTCAYMGGVMSLPEPFVWSWTQMVNYNTECTEGTGEYIHYDRITSSYHAMARNALAENFRGDWLLMLDTDHIFPPDLLFRLINSMNKTQADLMVGLYQYKYPPYNPVMYVWNSNGNGPGFYNFRPYVSISDQPFKVDASGAGCLLARRHVFKKIYDELREKPFDIESPFSEDLSFFNRVRRLGFKAYCDPKIEFHHLGYKPVTPFDYGKSEI